MKSRKKIETPRRRKRAKGEDGIPLIVFYWALGSGFLSYLIGRFVMEQHPWHWAAAIGGVLLGTVMGYIWFFIRGDVGLL